MSGEIVSIPLSAPPRQADKLSSKDKLLVAWQIDGYINDDNGMEYHFAIHSPVWGWRGYCWDKQYGAPLEIFIASQDIVWVHTFDYYLMRLRIGQNGEATIDEHMITDRVLDANTSSCLVKTNRRKIECLHFNKNKAVPSKSELYTGANICWACFLPDGAIATFDNAAMRLLVLSPEGDSLHEENVLYCDYYAPFIVHCDDGCLYYTDDPRKGWGRYDGFKVYQERIGEDVSACFFTILNDECYMAVEDSEDNVYLYRLASKPSECAEHAWGIAAEAWKYSLVCHNGLICTTSSGRVLGYGGTLIPENNGFLAWDPITNAFYTDLPRTTKIYKIPAGRIPSISIPDIWGQDILQR